MKIIAKAFIEQNENTDKNYSVRLVEGNNNYFVLINNDQRVKFGSYIEAEKHFNGIVAHVSPKPERRWNPAAFDKKTALIEEKIFTIAENYQF
jgi:hypothetical protein